MPSFSSYKELIDYGVAQLKTHEISNYKSEAEWILLKVINKQRTWLVMNFHESPDSIHMKNYMDMIYKRSDHIPLQVLLGEATFYGRDFNIFSDVFIPRQDSEIIIDICKKKKFQSALDLCSGSGCLGITLSLEYPASNVDLVEISDIAIENINSNIEKFGCENINVIHSDVGDVNFKKTYDIIISNPPYIDKTEIHNLHHTVRYYDPINALTDHGDGLSFYQKIFYLSESILNPGGSIILEFGNDQQINSILTIFKDFKHTLYKDRSNLYRALELTR